ncbi:putative A1 protein [Xanthomonas phage Xoo-sp13]|nr:putative A1 protein [Xanthomonas phage Xoo-sp13]
MSHKDIKRRQELEDFVLHYRTAHKHKWTNNDLADFFGIKADSIRRRVLNVKYQSGVSLPKLKDGVSTLTPDKLDKFRKEIAEAKSKIASASSIVDTIKSDGPRRVGRYLITSAQNNTPIHQPFFASLLNYCEENNAELLVIPYRYKNPTSVFTDKDYETWDSALDPYMVRGNLKICPELVLVGGVKIQPTAVQPLSGFEGYTGSSSAVFGHPKVQLKTVPTPNKELPKILTTTGAVTIPNYTDSKAGFKGEFHHSLAALVVEVTDEEFHIRHVHSHSDGSFYDLDSYYTTNEITTGHRVAALVTGDTHAMFLDKQVEAATYSNEDSIVKVLRPEMRVFHDLTDFYSRNHHHRGDDLLNFAKHLIGNDDVEAELQISADLVDKYNDPESLNVIVKSNHDEAFDRWLREANPLNDPKNARFFYYMKYNQYKSVKQTGNGRFSAFDPFEFWCFNPDQQTGLKAADNTHFLKRDESLTVGNIELGFHGDQGPNGARGSIQNMSKIGAKAIIGHSHSPGIYEGVYQVGTSSELDLGYNSGPSSWLTTHAVVYPDGKRTLIHIINGRWRAKY